MTLAVDKMDGRGHIGKAWTAKCSHIHDCTYLYYGGVIYYIVEMLAKKKDWEMNDTKAICNA